MGMGINKIHFESLKDYFYNASVIIYFLMSSQNFRTHPLQDQRYSTNIFVFFLLKKLNKLTLQDPRYQRWYSTNIYSAITNSVSEGYGQWWGSFEVSFSAMLSRMVIIRHFDFAFQKKKGFLIWFWCVQIKSIRLRFFNVMIIRWILE